MIRAGRAGVLFALCLGACGGGSGGGDAGDTLDVEVADETGGLRASTTIDGEEIRIEAGTEVEPGVADDGTAFELEYLVAVVIGADDTVYAEWRLNDLTDELSGTLGGVPFADALAEQPLARADRDWAVLASSRVGDVLTEVSSRAKATMEAAAHPAAERHLALVAQAGPLLQSLPTIVGGFESLCGDNQCTGDESDANCPEDCGCAAEDVCGSVAPYGCYCGDDCEENGDCCIDACQTCGAGCPACPEGVLPCGDTCTDVSNACDGEAQCDGAADEAQCNNGACRAGQLSCDDGTCIEFYQFCNGTNDCSGGEDELCTCAYCDPA